MSATARRQQARQLLQHFAERTGLTGEGTEKRYLWTDAFAVCTLLGMARGSGDEDARTLALRLVDRVHQTLGKRRGDDSRRGWLSGLDEDDGARHPTQGGLRIGKPLPERRAGEPFDDEREWESDGQYFHYLTKWMHALDQASRLTGQPHFNRWARELAVTAYRAFTVRTPGTGQLRMVWKMSIDLTRPLVASMGHHDALDGLVTYAQLQATASGFQAVPDGPDLAEALAGFTAMAEHGHWATVDPLGLGGLLMDACRVEQLLGRSAVLAPPLLPTLLAAALEGLPHYAQQADLRQPASRRLAFRELGLSLGLHAVELMRRRRQTSSFANEELDALLQGVSSFASLGSDIESCWLAPRHRESASWRQHRDINEVMLAASLEPEGCLLL
ncbi:MAG: hypothetical protein ACLPJH_02065 [Myxococcaceae bacterium]